MPNVSRAGSTGMRTSTGVQDDSSNFKISNCALNCWLCPIRMQGNTDQLGTIESAFARKHWMGISLVPLNLPHSHTRKHWMGISLVPLVYVPQTLSSRMLVSNVMCVLSNSVAQMVHYMYDRNYFALIVVNRFKFSRLRLQTISALQKVLICTR